jgi:hypothetical protein
MAALFDMRLRAQRRDRAARLGPELFLHERAFADCLDRLALVHRHFEQALLIGCPDPAWPQRLGEVSDNVQVSDPGPVFASAVRGQALIEDAWDPDVSKHDLVLTIGTMDTVNDFPLALRLIRRAMRSDGLFLGALSGGDTLPQLRAAMRAADAISGAAAPHVHPRIEASAFAPLLSDAGFIDPVVDVDRASVSYVSLAKLIADLRSMAATNILTARPRFLGKAALLEAARAFAAAGTGGRTVETFEIIHFAAWTTKER